MALAIKNLTSQELREFQERGEIEILGHKLTQEDIKVNGNNPFVFWKK